MIDIAVLNLLRACLLYSLLDKLKLRNQFYQSVSQFHILMSVFFIFFFKNGSARNEKIMTNYIDDEY